MPTSFPGAVDSLTNPNTTDPTTSPSHAGQHTNANDAIEAIETEVIRIRTPFALRATRTTSNQAIANLTDTDLVLNNIVREDDENSAVSYSTSTGIATVAVAGWYQVSAGISWASNSSGLRQIWVRLNTTVLARTTMAGSTIGDFQNVSTLIYAAAADTINARCRQTSGGSLDANTGAETHLTIARIR